MDSGILAEVIVPVSEKYSDGEGLQFYSIFGSHNSLVLCPSDSSPSGSSGVPVEDADRRWIDGTNRDAVALLACQHGSPQTQCLVDESRRRRGVTWQCFGIFSSSVSLPPGNQSLSNIFQRPSHPHPPQFLHPICTVDVPQPND